LLVESCVGETKPLLYDWIKKYYRIGYIAEQDINVDDVVRIWKETREEACMMWSGRIVQRKHNYAHVKNKLCKVGSSSHCDVTYFAVHLSSSSLYIDHSVNVPSHLADIKDTISQARQTDDEFEEIDVPFGRILFKFMTRESKNDNHQRLTSKTLAYLSIAHDR
jgi:hypothetical protein